MRKLWKYRSPLFNLVGALYTAKEAVRPRRRSAFRRHWGKALMAGAGMGLSYFAYRRYRPHGPELVQPAHQ
jgi:hypothetical protein